MATKILSKLRSHGGFFTFSKTLYHLSTAPACNALVRRPLQLTRYMSSNQTDRTKDTQTTLLEPILESEVKEDSAGLDTTQPHETATREKQPPTSTNHNSSEIRLFGTESRDSGNRRMARDLTATDRAAIVSRRKLGVTIKKIAAEFNATLNAVDWVIRLWNKHQTVTPTEERLLKKNLHTSETQRAAIISMRASGATNNKIAAELEVSEYAVRYTLKRWKDRQSITTIRAKPSKRRVELTETQRAAILSRLASGATWSSVMAELKVGVGAISSTIKRWRDHKTVHSRTHSFYFSPTDERLICELVRRQTKVTLRDVVSELRLDDRFDQTHKRRPSITTIYRALNKARALVASEQQKP